MYIFEKGGRVRPLFIPVYFVALSTPLLAQQAVRHCGVPGLSKTAHQQNVADLKWSLLSLQKLERVPTVSKDVTPLSGEVAKGAVSSLANLYSLRAQYVRDCNIDSGQYLNETLANQRFITFLWATTSLPSFQAALQKREVTNQRNTIDRESKVGKAIQQLKDSRRQQLGERALLLNDPIWVAASELQGENVDWKEESLNPLPERTPINPEGEAAAVKFSSSVKDLTSLKKMGFLANLKALSRYY